MGLCVCVCVCVLGGGGGYNHVGSLFISEELRMVAPDVKDNSVTHTGPVHDVTDAGCQSQNG